MKRINMALIIAVTAILAACTDKGGDEVDFASVAGVYSGYSLASCSYFTDMLAQNETLTVTDNGDETLTINYTSNTFGSFTMNCTATVSGGVYTISGSGVTEMGHGDATSEYDATVTATAGNGAAVFTFSVPSVMGGTTIIFYEGELPAARAVAGSYTGTFDMSVSGTAAGTLTDFGCTLTYVDDNTVSIALDDIEAMGTLTLTLVVDEVTVTASGSGYSLSGDIDTISGDYAITGSVSGTISSDGEAEITFEFTPGAMPMSITGVFSTASSE